jgi:hypothetical protein
MFIRNQTREDAIFLAFTSGTIGFATSGVNTLTAPSFSEAVSNS